MKKILFITGLLLAGSFVAQAQEDSDVVGTTTTTTKTKVIVKKETATVVISADEMNTEGDASTNTDDMKKILVEREIRARTIRAAKKAENKAYAEKAKTGVTTSKAKVVTKEMLEAEKIEKKKKVTKTDN